MLTSLDRRSENVHVLPVVITELEFGDIERHIFAAHFVECADDAALEDRPEAFNGLSVDCTDDVLTPGMIHSSMWKVFAKAFVAGPLIGAEQADFVRNCFADECFQRGCLDVSNYARNHVAFAANCANDWSFAGTDTAKFRRRRAYPNACFWPSRRRMFHRLRQFRRAYQCLP
jgi:hypothetical protein